MSMGFLTYKQCNDAYLKAIEVGDPVVERLAFNAMIHRLTIESVVQDYDAFGKDVDHKQEMYLNVVGSVMAKWLDDTGMAETIIPRLDEDVRALLPYDCSPYLHEDG